METLNARALCTLDDVKDYINLAEDVAQDDLIIRLINAASEAIHTITDREFVPMGSNPQIRTFDAYEVYANGFLYLGDFTDLESISIYSGASDQLINEVNMADVTMLPRNPKPWEPYQAIRLRNNRLAWDYYLDVLGDWGFPMIPDEIRQACVVTVSVWHARDIANFSATFSINEDRVELPRVVPPQVQDTIARFQSIPVV
jgi:hypothetical protein